MADNTLNENLDIIAQSNLEIEYLDGDLNIIQTLDDEPNDVGGLSAQQLKAKYDESGNIIKRYINEKLIPAVLEDDATEAVRTVAEEQRQTAEAARIAAEAARVAAEQARVDENAGTVARATEQAKKAEEWAKEAEKSVGGVASFNGRKGIVKSQSGDYTAMWEQ